MTFEVEATSDLRYDDGRPFQVINESPVATADVVADRQVQRLAQQLGAWVETARSGGIAPGMFNRALYQVSDNPYAQMRAARNAVAQDDIVSGIADATEALAFDGGLKWESADPDDADVFNQISADINLDGKIREMWREVFTVDQFVCVKLWDTVEYTVRGKTESGNSRKRRVKVFAPTQMSILKPENCVPIGVGPLRADRLAWQATGREIGDYSRVAVRPAEDLDPLMSAFFTGRYQPDLYEAAELAAIGVNTEQLLAMNPDWVFRHTSTKPDYAKFPDLRLRGVFDLLDLKRQLISSDRATLVGAANYILLIRKGSKEQPATQTEVDNLKAGYQFLAKLPVIISDHRLEIDVIAPKLDFVLRKDAYESLDSKIAQRVLQTFSGSGQRAASSGGVDVFSSVLASSIQSRRHMIKRTLERELSKAIVEHPKNAGVFQGRPSLVFTPRTVTVGVNQNILQALLALRTQRELSRDTILEYMGLDQATEAQRLEIEEKFFDDIFKTQIPFAAPGAGGSPAAGPNTPAPKTAPKATPNGTAEAPSVSGARGGRPTGGGSSSASPAKTAAPKSGNGNPTRSGR